MLFLVGQGMLTNPVQLQRLVGAGGQERSFGQQSDLQIAQRKLGRIVQQDLDQWRGLR